MAFMTVLWVVYLELFKALDWKKLLEIKLFCILMNVLYTNEEKVSMPIRDCK